MIFESTKLPGVYAIELERKTDERGFFARSWCRNEFGSYDLNPRLVQCNISFNACKGTLRGMHYQAEPYAEDKLVRCTRGAIYDVVVDLRQNSPSFKQWVAVTLSVANHRMLYIPKGCGHGFLTLEDDTEVFYQMSEFYNPESARGVRWNDPAFQIAWPAEVRSNFRKGPDLPGLRITAMRLLKELDQNTLEEIGREMHDFASALYPICRSITGDGIRRTLSLIQEQIPAGDLRSAQQERRSSTGPCPKSGIFATPISRIRTASGLWIFSSAICTC